MNANDLRDLYLAYRVTAIQSRSVNPVFHTPQGYPRVGNQRQLIHCSNHARNQGVQVSAEPKQATTIKQAYRPSWGHRPRRLSVVVGVVGLFAMVMLTLLSGRSTPDTPSSTTVIAAPSKTGASTNLQVPSAAPGVTAPPWAGQGWPGSNWFDIHKGS